MGFALFMVALLAVAAAISLAKDAWIRWQNARDVLAESCDDQGMPYGHPERETGYLTGYELDAWNDLASRIRGGNA